MQWSYRVTIPVSATIEEAFIYRGDVNASLSESLDPLSLATRYLIPGYQAAVDAMVSRYRTMANTAE
jgi:hypothetical protein